MMGIPPYLSSFQPSIVETPMTKHIPFALVLILAACNSENIIADTSKPEPEVVTNTVTNTVFETNTETVEVPVDDTDNLPAETIDTGTPPVVEPEPVDADGDGFPSDIDCDDGNANTFPGAAPLDDLVACMNDDDLDDFADDNHLGDVPAGVILGTDCDDGWPYAYPGAQNWCVPGDDLNCNQTDDSLEAECLPEPEEDPACSFEHEYVYWTPAGNEVGAYTTTSNATVTVVSLQDQIVDTADPVDITFDINADACGDIEVSIVSMYVFDNGVTTWFDDVFTSNLPASLISDTNDYGDDSPVGVWSGDNSDLMYGSYTWYPASTVSAGATETFTAIFEGMIDIPVGEDITIWMYIYTTDVATAQTLPTLAFYTNVEAQ
jgi:hypothetical protein